MRATRSFLTLALAGAVSSLHAIDVDLGGNGDGMSDVWQAKHSVAAGDTDSDGGGDHYCNLIESHFRTDPAVDGAPVIGNDMYGMGTIVLAGNYASVSLMTTLHVRYQPQISLDDSVWSPLGPVIIGDGNVQATVDDSFPFAAGQRQYFRVLALGLVDGDGDGLDAWEEAEVMTSDTDYDSDDDFVADGIEYALGLDPKDATDSDSNGLADDLEVYLASLVSDTDSDGVADSLDAFPDDPLASAPSGAPSGDTTAPAITLSVPAGAVPQ